ncbi:alpha/beta hydrolase [Marinihelvus fidelis]|uniref:Alpha/beta hydrolase n=1 Tax=Marinihelvus fidelis TaxID=2613842 RepID=A0A5N0TB04_9GAMM|nr:alpha/beta hydrolase [Marinihelvus fidelis]KAA9130996.1 alpha/beta hydrolase [Marinihelvus fidelis]
MSQVATDTPAVAGSSAGRETRIELPWGRLAALRFGAPTGRRALCLHGWMDNAASFIPLAPYLCADDALDMVALDLAGHGRSAHRPETSRYYFADYLFDIDRVLDELGWDDCTVIGHSLGAALGSAFAAAAPERVNALVMLDGLGLVTEPAEKAAERLRNAMRATRKPREHRRRFATLEDAAAIRQANNPMSDTAALLLAERALAPADDGWRWRTDARAMWPSPVFMTEPQSDAILDAIECPVLTVHTPVVERWTSAELVASRLGRLKCGNDVRLQGGHHVHMDAPEPVASAINDFLKTLEPDHD